MLDFLPNLIGIKNNEATLSVLNCVCRLQFEPLLGFMFLEMNLAFSLDMCPLAKVVMVINHRSRTNEPSEARRLPCFDVSFSTSS